MFYNKNKLHKPNMKFKGELNMKARIYYIYHSGFAVETTNHLLIFDYYKDPSSIVATLINNVLSNINKPKMILVFSSHSHNDHFNPEILKWKNSNSDIKYFLNTDINIEENNPNCYHISEDDEITEGDIYVKAYGSTDIGISFLVKVDGVTIFHAGDLNWWHWKEDSKEEQTLAEISFKAIIEKMKEHKNEIDIAFFPVDPRLEEFYFIGGKHFAEVLKPKQLVPMHFADSFYITEAFNELMDKIKVNSSIIKATGEEITY